MEFISRLQGNKFGLKRKRNNMKEAIITVVVTWTAITTFLAWCLLRSNQNTNEE